MRGVALEPIEPTASATQIRVRSAAVGRRLFSGAGAGQTRRRRFSCRTILVEFSEAGVRIVGRLSDVINVAGKKVNPAEVEAQLLGHTGVRQAVVFGRASALRNEEVVACVVAAEEARRSGAAGILPGRLSGWQVPKRIFLVASLPGERAREDQPARAGRPFPRNLISARSLARPRSDLLLNNLKLCEPFFFPRSAPSSFSRLSPAVPLLLRRKWPRGDDGRAHPLSPLRRELRFRSGPDLTKGRQI